MQTSADMAAAVDLHESPFVRCLYLTSVVHRVGLSYIATLPSTAATSKVAATVDYDRHLPAGSVQHLFRVVLLIAVGAQPGFPSSSHILQLQAITHQQARPAEAPMCRVAAAAL